MAGSFSDAAIVEQILALVSDFSHVVSYKWLSRKFSISSNAAKRLLDDFVDKHGDGVQVVYVVSGWKREQLGSYSVQLVKKAQLEGAKALLAEVPSVHVYSVQASLPKDPAQLWNADYVQAEEFFNQPPDVVNCLRDNRFSAVACSFVTRVSNIRRQLPESSSKAGPSAASELKQPQTLQETHKVATNNSKGNAEAQKPESGTGQGSNLWGRASNPPKPANESVKIPVAGTSDANIKASEEHENDGSSDDDIAHFARVRRGGKRRVIFDDEVSDDVPEQQAEEEEIVRLASPEKSPLGQKDAPTIKSESSKDFQQRSAGPNTETKKKRKVLRTRIDERGREVSEVVWETEGESKDVPPVKPDAKNVPLAMPEIKHESSSAKPPNPTKQTVKASTSKVASKRAGKNGKPGPQQGSITSFFKKK